MENEPPNEGRSTRVSRSQIGPAHALFIGLYRLHPIQRKAKNGLS